MVAKGQMNQPALTRRHGREGVGHAALEHAFRGHLGRQLEFLLARGAISFAVKADLIVLFRVEMESLFPVPLDGVYPVAPNQLDTIGPLARDVASAVRGMDLLQPGFSGRYRQAMAAKPAAKALRIGRIYIEGTNPRVDHAVDDALATTGFTVVNLSQEFTDKWIQAQKDAATVAGVGAWSYDRKFQNESQVTLRTKAVLAVGGMQKTAYHQALRGQAAWRSELRRVFEKVDFIALPTLKNVPLHLPLFGGTVAFEARALALQNTQAVNLGGVPALAIPVPIAHESVRLTSLQLVGRPFAEADLLNAGRLVEAAVKR